MANGMHLLYLQAERNPDVRREQDKKKERRDRNWIEAGKWMKESMLRMSPQDAKWRAEGAARMQEVVQARVDESWKHHTARHKTCLLVDRPQACHLRSMKSCKNI
eukprot:827302-Pelagomonas_calceolata.AAC.1